MSKRPIAEEMNVRETLNAQKKIRCSIFVISLLLMSACHIQGEKDKAERGMVQYYGALKNMMHKGDISAKVDLNDLKEIPNLYALGAIENLKGEIQIFNGEAYNSSVLNDTIVFNHTFDQKATLLVHASVKEWRSFEIPAHVVLRQELEEYIEQTATQSHLNTDQPFPFLLEGAPKSIDWHVINWKDGDTEHSHEKHINSGLNGTLKDVELKALGFYSRSHQAIFTHHTSYVHMHFKTNDHQVAGHIDDIVLKEGMVLKLPKITKS